jgi:hypothetical protein
MLATISRAACGIVFALFATLAGVVVGTALGVLVIHNVLG